MTATAVIPHWNRRELLDTLLRSIGDQTRPFDEVIVADNGSTDGSAQVAAQHGARVIELGRNFGFAAAVNRGIEAARSGWIAILNNDVVLDAANCCPSARDYVERAIDYRCPIRDRIQAQDLSRREISTLAIGSLCERRQPCRIQHYIVIEDRDPSRSRRLNPAIPGARPQRDELQT